MRQQYSTLALVILLSAGCERALPTTPARPASPPPPIVPSPPGFSSLGGHWEGSSTVESITGDVPSCIAPFWRPTSTDAISAEIRPSPDGSKQDMVLHQRASEGCHVQLAADHNGVAGGPWPYDEFDCALVPSLCLGCHFRLTSSEWNCAGTPPDVWILGVDLSATIGDQSRDRMQGTMSIAYDHRPGNYPTAGGGYRRVTVVTRFEIRNISR